VWSSLLGCAVGFALFIGPHVLGGMGAGDVKLAAAVGAIMGYPFVVWATANACLLGLVVVLVVLARRGALRAMARRLVGHLRAALLPGLEPPVPGEERFPALPFGAFLALGAVLNLYTEARYAALDLAW
jgi:prepilin peptidase CpaA